MNTFVPQTTTAVSPPFADADEKPNQYRIKEGTIAGLVVHLTSIQPLLLNKVLRSVKRPKRPTYETQTVTGGVQVHPMDKESAAETPGGKAMWEYYEEQVEEAESEQNDRMTTAIFAMGCDFDWKDVPKDRDGNVIDWESQHRLLGIDVPQEVKLKKAHFLATSLKAEEISAITTKIMKLSGVDEATVKEAEENFRDSVRDRSGETGNVVDLRPGAEGYTEQQMAIQPALREGRNGLR